MIAVWFSCGAASAAAARLTIDKYGHENVRVVNSPVVEEHEDNRRFLADVQRWLGLEIETAVNPKFPNASAVEVWEKRKFMSSVYGAPCTIELKKEARRHWEQTNSPEWHVLGFTADERQRHDRFVMTERSNVLPVLIDAGMRKKDCLEMIKAAGIDPPLTYSLGMPNANCKGCVRSSSPTYWNLIRRLFPDDFAARAEQSRRLGAKLVQVKGERVFLDELLENADGQMQLDFDCGVFCEEPSAIRAAAGGGEDPLPHLNDAQKALFVSALLGKHQPGDAGPTTPPKAGEEGK